MLRTQISRLECAQAQARNLGNERAYILLAESRVVNPQELGECVGAAVETWCAERISEEEQVDTGFEGKGEGAEREGRILVSNFYLLLPILLSVRRKVRKLTSH